MLIVSELMWRITDPEQKKPYGMLQIFPSIGG
jgi:hypothetical protein